MLLPLIRPQLESAFGQYPGGTDLLNRLFENVKFSLVHGIQVIFFWGAVIMSAAVLLNLALREIPLRGRVEAPPAIE